MKNIINISDPQKIKNFVYSLWKTKEFQGSHAKAGDYVNRIVEKFSESPRFFYESSDDHLERGHFTSWMNFICLREYENPAIQDLYYLHEILHASTMKYIPSLEFVRWKGKMIDNEVEVSLDSEVLVYHHLKSLREKSFSFEIWADSIDFSKIENADFRKDLKKERIRIYKSPNPKSNPEMEISRYHKQNEEWSKIWKDNYSDVEKTLSSFYELATGSKDDASQFLLTWMNSQLLKNQGLCPYLKEAKLVSKIYWKNKNEK
jgi:hypothetical protein